MKCHRQLNQSLEMPSKVAVAGSLSPHVFEGLMSVEEVAGVEKGQAALAGVFVHCFNNDNVQIYTQQTDSG